MGKITVHSSSLHTLDVSIHGHRNCQGIDIVTPVLKQLHLNVSARKDIGVSISAPLVEHVSWNRSYTNQDLPLLFGSWQLRAMSVHTKERNYTCWQHQLPQFHVMCLYLSVGVRLCSLLLNLLVLGLHIKFIIVPYAWYPSSIVLQNDLDAQLNFAQEMDKLPVTNFSALELNFASDWHVYGALVLQLLRVRRIRATAKKLKVIMPWFPKVMDFHANVSYTNTYIVHVQ
jgi:hypothetical protein